MMRRLLLAFVLMLLAAPAFAVNPDEVLADPALEARARALSAELRCMVCQNQSIDDSNAELARISGFWCASASRMATVTSRC